MRYIFAIFTIFLFTGAIKRPEQTRLPWHRSFYAEMKKLEKPPKTQAFAAVQTATNAGVGTTCAVTVSSTGSNNLLVVSVWVVSTVNLSSITDNQGNTYSIGTGTTVASSYKIYQGYGVQVTGSVTTVTATIASSSEIVVIVDEFSGFTGTPTNAEVFDIAAANTCVVTSPCTTGTFSPVQSGCLIVGTVMDDTAPTFGASSGYTLYGTSDYGGYVFFRTSYKLSSGTSENPGFTMSPNANSTGVLAKSYKQEDWIAAPAGKSIRSVGTLKP